MSEEFLSADDFNDPPKMVPTEIKGKKAFIRVISYDDQCRLSRFKGTAEDQTKLMLVLCLCNEKGEKIFPNIKAGMKAFGNTEVTEIFEAAMKASEANGMGDASEKKSPAVRKKRSE